MEEQRNFGGVVKGELKMEEKQEEEGTNKAGREEQWRVEREGGIGKQSMAW